MTRNTENNNDGSPRPRSGRGFAGMDPVRQREISSQGGRAAHEKGTAHEFDSAEARVAGRKGGEVVSQDRDHMAEIGSRGGLAAHSNRQRQGTTANDEPGAGE
jgi:hypothetical protein